MRVTVSTYRGFGVARDRGLKIFEAVGDDAVGKVEYHTSNQQHGRFEIDSLALPLLFTSWEKNTYPSKFIRFDLERTKLEIGRFFCLISNHWLRL